MYYHGMTPKFYTFGKLISDLLDLVERGRNTQQSDLIGLDMMNSEKKEFMYLGFIVRFKEYYDGMGKINYYRNIFAHMCHMIMNQR